MRLFVGNVFSMKTFFSYFLSSFAFISFLTLFLTNTKTKVFWLNFQQFFILKCIANKLVVSVWYLIFFSCISLWWIFKNTLPKIITTIFIDAYNEDGLFLQIVHLIEHIYGLVFYLVCMIFFFSIPASTVLNMLVVQRRQ